MPSPQMSLEQFGQHIKDRYPDYNDLDNVDLANRVLKKYPEYGDMVQVDHLQHPAGATFDQLPGVPKAPSALDAIPSQQEMGDLWKQTWSWNKQRSQEAQQKYAAAQHARGGTDAIAQAVELGKDEYNAHARHPLLWKGLDYLAQGPTGNSDFFEKGLPEKLKTDRGTPGTLDAGDSKGTRIAKGIGRGLYGIGSGLSTPENLAILGGMAAAPESSWAKAAKGIFTGQAFKGAKDEAVAAYKADDLSDKFEHGTGALVNGVFGALGGVDLLHETFGSKAPTATLDPAVPKGTPKSTRVTGAGVNATMGGLGAVAAFHEGDITPVPSEAPKTSSVPSANERTVIPEQPAPATTKAETVATGHPVQTDAVPSVANVSSVSDQAPKTEAQPQSINPSPQPSSIEAQESDLRSKVGRVLRIKQLSQAAKDRFNVEVALNLARSVTRDENDKLVTDKTANDIAPSRKNFDELSPDRQAMLQSVAKALKVPVESLQNEYENWRLTDAQVKQLEQMKKAGLRPLSIKGTGHPEEAFGDQVAHPLADINEANARAASITNPKDLWGKIPGLRQKRIEWRASNAPEVNAQDTTAPGMQVVGRNAAERRGDVAAGGKSIDDLQFEHDSMQQALSAEYSKARAALRDAIPAWKEARANEQAPSKLAQDIRALGQASRDVLPKELYAKEHLTAKTPNGPTSPAVQEPVQGTEGPKATPSGEGTPQPKEQEGPSDPFVAKMDEAIAKHGTPAEGGFVQLFSEVGKKYRNPETVQKVFEKLVGKYIDGLNGGAGNALQDTLDHLKSLPQEKGTSTVYSNPIGPLWNKFFGQRQTGVVKATLPNVSGLIPDKPITSLTQALENRPATPANERFQAYWGNEIDDFMRTWREMPGTLKDRWDASKSFFDKVKQAYLERPGLNAVEFANGLRQLALTKASYELSDFVDTINKRHPDKLRRSAMAAYIEAGGGRLADDVVRQTIEDQMHDLAGKTAVDRTAKTFHQIYDAARDLSPEEKQTVSDYRDYLSRIEQTEAQAGLTHDAQLDYLQHIWSRDNFVQNSLKGIQSGAGFGTSASFAKMRSFDTYYEGILKGFKPNSLDLTYLVSARAQASARVLANRSLVKFLYDHTMPDGGKAAYVEGTGTYQSAEITPEDEKGAILIRETGKPARAFTREDNPRPYEHINHSSFQNWKWIAKAEDGTNVLYKGSMLVHPDIARSLKDMLEPSALREGRLGAVAKPLLRASSIGKQTLLIGLFHPVQLGTHLLEHAAVGSTNGTTSSRIFRALNPFSTEKFVDLSQTHQQQLVIHGLKLRDFDAESLMDEGVMSRGFVTGLPFTGKLWGAVHDTMFQKMIPNMKMALAQDVLERNMRRYHDKWMQEELNKAGISSANPGSNANAQLFQQASVAAQDRIYRLTAEQTNAAFGGLDWSKMPVNKTAQDVLRLCVLAPDFLLARMQFVGDAFRPGGAESRKALGVGFAIQYLSARMFNAAMNDGDAKWDIHDWNKFIIGHHEVSLRTVQGDLVDSIMDPRRFWEHRINPMTRPAIEAYTGRDVFGHPVNAGQKLLDAAKNFVPMPLQGGVDWAASKFDARLRAPKNAENLIETMTQSMSGLQLRKYRTPAERSVFNDFDAIQGPPSQDELAMEQNASFNYIRDQYQKGKLTDDDIENAMEGNGKHVPGIGKLTLKPTEANYLFRTKEETQLVTRARQLQPNQILNAWEKGSEMEKLQLTPILANKLKTMPPQDQERISDILDKFIDNLPADKQDKLSDQIEKEIVYEHPELQEDNGQ